MIKQLIVQNGSGNQLTIPVAYTRSSLVVTSIDGLDPVKASLVSNDFAQIDGSLYQSSRRDNRNINIRIALRPDYAAESVRDIRTRLYSYLMPKSKVKLYFVEDDGVRFEIEGYVETFDAAIFSKETAVNVSVMCFSPDFVESTNATLLGSTTSTTSATTIAYRGSVETGVLFTMIAPRAMSGFTLYNTTPSGVLEQMDYTSPLATGDKIVVNTLPGHKEIMLTRASDGYTGSTLYGISPSSKWIALYPGDNQFWVHASGASVPYTLEYSVRHGGL